MNIIFDYNRTIYDPEVGALYPGALDVLRDLSREHDLYLVSRNEPNRQDYLTKAGIAGFFKKVVFVDEKSIGLFAAIAEKPGRTITIGDKLSGEIRIGNKLGHITIRVAQGRFAKEKPLIKEERPLYEVKRIEEVLDIIKRYED